MSRGRLAFGNWSVLYSLVQTAERHGINPLDYVHPAARIDEILPDRWKPAP